MRTLQELGSLKGRIALITGGAGHIGAAIGDALAELGAAVAILDLNASACAARAADLRSRFGVAAIGLPIDLENELAVRAAPTQTVEALGGLDILVHCAALVGVTPLKGWTTPFAEQNADTWRRALEVNLTSVFVLTQAAIEPLSASGKGSVITIGSLYAMVGPDHRLYDGTTMGNPAAYAASKGGLLQLTRWMATTLAPAIRVNAISPGGVWRNQPQAFQERFVARTPLGRMATEEDLKGSAAFLAGDLSSYVTGHNLIVDGGWTAW